MPPLRIEELEWDEGWIDSHTDYRMPLYEGLLFQGELQQSIRSECDGGAAEKQNQKPSSHRFTATVYWSL